ncbi:hypothetical protein KX816_07210 [Sphingosinicellaceae bacterium]|nr:hypothetical protein KX816_07210 [Sphingosinicellaceae bacterium]
MTRMLRCRQCPARMHSMHAAKRQLRADCQHGPAASLLPALRGIRPYAALLALGVISDAILFHLFTPLGVSVVNTDGSRDGGELFALACGVWASAAILIIGGAQTVARLSGLSRRCEADVARCARHGVHPASAPSRTAN